MTNDLISQAEALIEIYKTSGRTHRDATLLLPRLVSEIKLLRAQGQAKDFGLSGLSNEVYQLREQLAKWQQIAIDERAKQMNGPCDFRTKYEWCDNRQASCDGFPHMWECCPNKDRWRSIAVKELGLQGYKTAHEPNGPIEINGERYVRESEQKAYIDRLEAAYLDMWKIALSDKDGNLTPDQLKELTEAANNMLQLQAHAALEKIHRG